MQKPSLKRQIADFGISVDINSLIDDIIESLFIQWGGDVYTVTKAKAKLSSIINEVEHKHKMVFISKKGKNIAVIVPLEEYIKQFGNHPSNKGLRLAENALADIEDIDRFIDDIYQARGQTFERKIHL